MITLEDCGTPKGITKGEIDNGHGVEANLAQAIRGRVSRINIVDPLTGEVVVRDNEMITLAAARKLEEMRIDNIPVRSPMTCEASRGVCRACYGMDLATGQLVELGAAVGIIAAQSIEVPRTPLARRTFHIGGAGLPRSFAATPNSSGGFPRVIELLEAKRPAEPAFIAGDRRVRRARS